MSTNSISMWETLPSKADWDCFKSSILQEILWIERRDSRASPSHEPSLEPTPARSVDLVNTVFILTSLKTELARSVRGPKLQGPRAEGALAQPYLVQTFLVI